jgi:hypothetical protein
MTAVRTPEQIVGAVAAYGLPGAPPLPTEALDDQAWRAVFDLATRDRLTPLLAGAVADGALPASTRQAEQATAAHEQSMRLCVLLERALLETGTRFDASGIMYRVLKGPAVAHLDYPDPAQRAFGDVDVLVASSAYDSALEVLSEAGAHRRFTEVRSGFDRRWGKGACLVAADGTQIDVHRTFVAGPFGLTIDLDELLRTTEPVTIGGRRVSALDRPGRFLHACFHAALGDRVARLVALRDVAQLILTTDLDRAEVMARAARWRADAVVARAVRLTWFRLELASHPWATWAGDHRADRFQSRALHAYTAESRSYATQVAAGLAAVRSVPEKVAYMRALLISEPGHLSTRDRSYGRRVQRALRAFGSTRGPR